MGSGKREAGKGKKGKGEECSKKGGKGRGKSQRERKRGGDGGKRKRLKAETHVEGREKGLGGSWLGVAAEEVVGVMERDMVGVVVGL